MAKLYINQNNLDKETKKTKKNKIKTSPKKN